MNIKIWSTNNKLPSYISYFINSIEEQSWVKDFFQCKSAKVGTGTWIEKKKIYIKNGSNTWFDSRRASTSGYIIIEKKEYFFQRNKNKKMGFIT